MTSPDRPSPRSSAEIAALEAAIARRPGDLAARVDLVLALDGSPEGGAPREALLTLCEAAWRTGHASMRQGALDAVRALIAAARDDETSGAARLLHARMMVASAEEEGRSVDAAQVLADLDPLVGPHEGPAARARAFTAIAVALHLRDVGRAKTWLERVLPMASAEEHTLAAAIELEAGEAETALARCETALAASGEHPELLNTATLAALTLADATRAVPYAEAAFTLAPERLDIGLNLAAAHALAGAPAHALGLIDGLRDRHGEHPLLTARRAELCAQLGLAPDAGG